MPLRENKKLDLIIIERVHREYMLFTEEISRQLRQIELLTIYKCDQKENCTFSTVLYICNEIFYQNINSEFNPYHPFIKRELDNYQKIKCIRQNNDVKHTKQIKNIIKNGAKFEVYIPAISRVLLELKNILP